MRVFLFFSPLLNELKCWDDVVLTAAVWKYWIVYCQNLSTEWQDSRLFIIWRECNSAVADPPPFFSLRLFHLLLTHESNAASFMFIYWMCAAVILINYRFVCGVHLGFQVSPLYIINRIVIELAMHIFWFVCFSSHWTLAAYATNRAATFFLMRFIIYWMNQVDFRLDYGLQSRRWKSGNGWAADDCAVCCDYLRERCHPKIGISRHCMSTLVVSTLTLVCNFNNDKCTLWIIWQIPSDFVPEKIGNEKLMKTFYSVILLLSHPCRLRVARCQRTHTHNSITYKRSKDPSLFNARCHAMCVHACVW